MTITEQTALSTRTEQSFEVAQTSAAVEKQTEIQGAIIIAKRFPRNEDLAFQKLMKACDRTSFAEECIYSFPRSDSRVEGASINLAREAKRVWGNIVSGFEITREDEGSRKIRAYAWDIETNAKEFAEDEFQKLVYRKKGGWIIPDERDLRELTNRRAAILVRNCILSVLPKDLIEDAMDRARVTLKAGVEKDPEAARKKVILAFSELNITPEMLGQKLDHPIAQSSPAEIEELRKIYQSIKDGNSTWAEYVATHTNGEEPRRKSDADSARETATPANSASSEQFPLDLSRPYHVADVQPAAKKGAPFTLILRETDAKLRSTDQRLYISCVSAKQSGADVIIEARRGDGNELILIGIEEMNTK